MYLLSKRFFFFLQMFFFLKSSQLLKNVLYRCSRNKIGNNIPIAIERRRYRSTESSSSMTLLMQWLNENNVQFVKKKKILFPFYFFSLSPLYRFFLFVVEFWFNFFFLFLFCLRLGEIVVVFKFRRI